MQIDASSLIKAIKEQLPHVKTGWRYKDDTIDERINHHLMEAMAALEGEIDTVANDYTEVDRPDDAALQNQIAGLLLRYLVKAKSEETKAKFITAARILDPEIVV